MRRASCALGAEEDARLRRAEISLEHVAVVGVHDAGARAATGGPVVDGRRQPAERAGLGHVRVDDVRTKVAQDVEQLRERDGVVRGRDRPPQRRQVSTCDGAPVSRYRMSPSPASELAVHEQRLEAARRQAIGQRDRLNRRPADVQARDDADDAHRGNSIRCDRDWSRAS